MCVGYGLSVECGDLGGGFRLADGGFGLLGKKGAVTLGVGVALGDGSGNARATGSGWIWRGVGGCASWCALSPPGAMLGETLGSLFF